MLILVSRGPPFTNFFPLNPPIFRPEKITDGYLPAQLAKSASLASENGLEDRRAVAREIKAGKHSSQPDTTLG